MSMPLVSMLPKSSFAFPAPMAAPASRLFTAPSRCSRCRAAQCPRARPRSLLRPHLGDHDVAAVDDLLVVQIQGVAVHRDVQVARRGVRPAKLLVGPGREQNIRVERPPLLADTAGILPGFRPQRLLVKPPSD